MKYHDHESPANDFDREIDEMLHEEVEEQAKGTKIKALLKRSEAGSLPEVFDQSVIIEQIERMRNEPKLVKRYMYRLGRKFDSGREIKVIEQWKKQIESGIALINTMTEAEKALIEQEKAKAELYKVKKLQEIINIEVDQDKQKIIAKGEADIKEEKVRSAEADAKIAEAQARARKAGQPEKKESKFDKLEREIKEEAETIKLNFQLLEEKLTALAELEKKIRTRLAGEDDLIRKYVNLAKRFVFVDEEM